MSAAHSQKEMLLNSEQLTQLFRRHRQGAFVRAGASLFMWLYAFMAFKLGVIESKYILAVSQCVAYLILINPPLLWILRVIRRRSRYEFFSIFINLLEIIGYTSIIYSMGGVNALYLSPIYAALIAYVGAVSPPRHPFIIAALSSIALLCMAGLQYVGVLPDMEPFWKLSLPRSNQIVTLMATICLLFVVAFIISYTAGLLRKNKVALRTKNIELEKSKADIKRVAELLKAKNDELKAAVQRAEESDALKSQFLANVSHDLRTPLNHIIGFTELVLNPKIGDLNSTQREYLTDVHSSSKHLLALINDILDFSKIEAGKLELTCRPVDLKALVETSMSMVSEAARSRSIEMAAQIGGIPEHVVADEVRIKQVLYNLLSNAVKFTHPGGRVAIAAQSGPPASIPDEMMPAGARADYVQLTVSDTGVGIQKQDMARVFQSFEQIDNDAGRNTDGTGLGLAIARNLVELHEGRMWVESPGKNQGSTFSFVIPIKGPRKQNRPQPEPVCQGKR